MNVLNDIQSIMHGLMEEELDALIDDLNALYTKYNAVPDVNYDKR